MTVIHNLLWRVALLNDLVIHNLLWRVALLNDLVIHNLLWRVAVQHDYDTQFVMACCCTA